MIKKIQQDFSYYSHEFKDNYRKGVHRLRTILASRAQAQAFVSNAGGTAVVLGYEPETPDKNAQELYALLAASPYIDDAVQTFLGSIYEAGAESQDAMYSDSARCLEILHDPVMSRAAGAGTVSAGKWIATLAGQSCNLYRDMNAVAASDIAMTAVAASETAMTALIANTAAFNTVVTSHVAMNAVASSYVAVAAVYESAVAVEAVKANETAWATLTGATSAVMGKAAAKLAGLNPADYADMAAIASSSTAMAAIASSSTAMAAIEKSQVAKDAIAASDMATAKYAVGAAGLKPADYANMAAVAASQTAMAAIASSSTAMAAIASSSIALNAIAASTTALDAIYAKKKRMSGASASLSGKFIILQISNDNAFDTSQYGYATLSDGSKPKWDSYKGKYAYFKQYKKIATYMKNDTDRDDWIDYFQC